MHLLQGLNVVCFALFKKIWVHKIRMFEAKNFHDVSKNNFAKVFGMAYLHAFTPQLILQAWEATGVFSFNDKIVPPEKTAPSEMSTVKFTSSIIHSMPMQKVMAVFSYYKPPPLDLSPMDVEDKAERPVNERGEYSYHLM